MRADFVAAGFAYSIVTGRLYRDGVPCYSLDKHGYRIVSFNGRSYRQHRVAWLLVTGEWPAFEIDHEDRRPWNNSWHNLREATHPQNAQNRVAHRNSKSGVRGVRWREKDKLWEPRIMKDGRPVNLGLYACLLDAVAARKRAERTLFTHAS